jgi:hypothetical protein
MQKVFRSLFCPAPFAGITVTWIMRFVLHELSRRGPLRQRLEVVLAVETLEDIDV